MTTTNRNKETEDPSSRRRSKSAALVQKLLKSDGAKGKTSGENRIEWNERPVIIPRPIPVNGVKRNDRAAGEAILRTVPQQPPPHILRLREENVGGARRRRRLEERPIDVREMLESIPKPSAETNVSMISENNDADLADKSKMKNNSNEKITVKVALERFAGNNIIIGSRRTRGRVRNQGPAFQEKTSILKSFGEGVLREGDLLAGPSQKFDVLFMLQNKCDEPEWGYFSNPEKKKVLFVNRDIFSFYSRTNFVYQITIKKYPDDPTSVISDYRYVRPTETKLQKFLNSHPDFEIVKYPKLGREILVCLNATKGFGKNNSDPITWATSVVSMMKFQSNDTIRIRVHPRDTGLLPSLIRCYRTDRQIVFSDPRSETLHQFLNRGRLAVIYNSTISIPCIMKGIPICIEGNNNVGAPLSCGRLDNNSDGFTLNDGHYTYEQRKEFIYSLISSVWTLDEMRSGAAWKYYKKELYGQ